jgi:hypothetical protein
MPVTKSRSIDRDQSLTLAAAATAVRLVEPAQPARNAGEPSECFSGDLLQDVSVHTETATSRFNSQLSSLVAVAPATRSDQDNFINLRDITLC